MKIRYAYDITFRTPHYPFSEAFTTRKKAERECKKFAAGEGFTFCDAEAAKAVYPIDEQGQAVDPLDLPKDKR